MLHRRQFLGALAGAAALLGLPAAVLAEGRRDRRFIFVFAGGGWDPLCVFAPLFDSRYIDMEPEADRMNIGDFRLVDHPQRPAVRRFFETWGAKTLVFNGISTRSVAHDVCTYVAMTGSSSGSESDWPSVIGHAALDRYTIPTLVLNGPVLPGNREVAVARAGNGMLGALVRGDISEYVDRPTEAPNRRASLLMDRLVAKRAARIRDALAPNPAAHKLAADLDTSIRQSVRLKRISDRLGIEDAYDFRGRLQVAVSALAQGVSRTVTLTDGGDWDTHDDNTPQSPLFDHLFGGLDALMTTLAQTPDLNGDPLSATTTVVVLSEMGRTPRYNASSGRDHWPYTSALVLGDLIRGGRELGAYDARFSGVGIDPISGDLNPDALGVSAEEFGATLLTLADIDPKPILPRATPILGLLA